MTRSESTTAAVATSDAGVGVAIAGLGPFAFAAAVLQTVLWFLVPMPGWLRAAGLASCVVLLALARTMLRGRRRGWRIAALVGVWLVTASLFAVQFIGAGPMREPHLLYAAVLLLHGAVGLILLLRPLPWPPPAETALLAGSLVVGLLIAQAVLGGRAPQAQPGVVWEGMVVEDSLLGQRYVPYSNLLIHYPSDPRNYFELNDPGVSGWLLARHGGAAEFTPAAGDGDAHIVRIDSVFMPETYAIQLNSPGLAVRRGTRYRVRLEARAVPDRQIQVGLAMGTAPWTGLGLYHGAELDSTWRPIEVEFTATQTHAEARLHLDLGGPAGTVWVRGLALVDAATGDTLGRSTKPDHVVRYAFNEFGCRDQDYAHERVPGTVRILGLGDSFMMGVGVHAADMFTAQLRRLLEERAASRGEQTRFEVINCGVSGYATREERLFYETRLRAYRPDIVLLGMVYNDDRSWIDDVAMGYVDEAGKGWWLSRIWKTITGAPTGRPPANFDEALWEIVKLDRTLTADGTRLVTFAFRNQSFGPGFGGGDWRTLVRSMEVGLAGTGIPFHDLGEQLLAKYAPSELSVHPVDVHPNEIAHRLAAEAMVQILEDEGLLPLHTPAPDRLSSGRADRIDR